MTEKNTYPRLLIVDFVQMGSISATGQMKKNLFAEWPSNLWLQIYCKSPKDQEFYLFSEDKSLFLEGSHLKEQNIIAKCKAFHPDLIYYRPVANNLNFHNFACKLINELGVPVVTHIVDDWPNRLLLEKPDIYSAVDQSLRDLLNKSAACFSITESMSQAFKKRYGLEFTPIANCIEPKDWSLRKQKNFFKQFSKSDPFVIRYIGALADDMNFSSISDIVKALENLHKQFPLKLEIYTWSLWKKKAIQAFSGISYVSIHESNFSQSDYRNLLMTSNCLIVAYNFDSKSINYVRHSMANKLPECMASGVPTLVYGPIEIATVAYAASTQSVQLVTERNQEKLTWAIKELIQDPSYCQKLGQKARNFAFEKHNACQIRLNFYNILKESAKNLGIKNNSKGLDAAKNKQPIHIQPIQNKTMIFSELELLVRFPYLKAGLQNTIVDVGGHVGSVSQKFAIKGWRVIAFEPEPENRKELEKNLSNYKDITIIPKAVSNENGQYVSFYVSSEHWGIHSLKPFHPTHKPTMTVETVRLDTTLRNLSINDVSLLKVDVEGADFLVLQGFDFSKIKPELVMCEFADDRSLPNFGCTHHDIATYMTKKGYRVFVSEWDHIKEYGKKGKKTEPHIFLQCVPYPLKHNPAWGNLIFVRNDRIKDFEEVLHSYLLELGDKLAKSENKNKAISHYQNALSIKSVSTIYHKIGDLLLNQNQLEQAQHYFNQAIQMDSKKPWPYRGLGQVLERQDKHEESAQAYRQALQLKPDYETAKILLTEVTARPVLIDSQRKIGAFKDKHKGERCVIIGNGPSLNKMDLSFLKHETCFGMNRIYLGFEKWGFTPTYYVTVNKLVIEQSVEEILGIPCPKFISNKGIAHLPNREDVIFIKTLPYRGGPFSLDPATGVKEGSTVTYVAMQLAYYMGFETVILIGVDHNFVTKGQPHKEIVSQGDDPNHFHPSYFGKGTRWHLPDLETSEEHYKIADRQFKANGRQIVDATLDGHCQVFTKKHYKEIFQEDLTKRAESSFKAKKISSEISYPDSQKYSECINLAWSMYQNNDLESTVSLLKRSLDYSPYLTLETVVDWTDKFRNFSTTSGKEFCVDSLSNSPQWDRLIDTIFSQKLIS
jgi:FkbM family methyltransferase